MPIISRCILFEDQVQRVCVCVLFEDQVQRVCARPRAAAAYKSFVEGRAPLCLSAYVRTCDIDEHVLLRKTVPI